MACITLGHLNIIQVTFCYSIAQVNNDINVEMKSKKPNNDARLLNKSNFNLICSGSTTTSRFREAYDIISCGGRSPVSG